MPKCLIQYKWVNYYVSLFHHRPSPPPSFIPKHRNLLLLVLATFQSLRLTSNQSLKSTTNSLALYCFLNGLHKQWAYTFRHQCRWTSPVMLRPCCLRYSENTRDCAPFEASQPFIVQYVSTVGAAEWDIVAFGTMGSEISSVVCGRIRIVPWMCTVLTEYKMLKYVILNKSWPYLAT